VPEQHRARYARLVVTLAGVCDEELAEPVHAALAAWGPWAPQGTGVLARAVTDPRNRRWTSAVDALADLALTTAHTRADVLAVLDYLAAAAARDDPPDAETDTARPARARVRRLARRLAASGDH